MEILLGKYGELALKGLNKNRFEQPLLKTVRRRLSRCGDFKVYAAQSTLYAEPLNDAADLDAAFDQIGRVFGLAAVSRAALCEKSFDAICETAGAYLADALRAARTFKVAARRSDKRFPMDSMAIARELGAYLLEKFPHLSVTMDHPDLTVVVEVRDYAAFVHSPQRPGAGGIPTGTGGRVACLMSGGIDSPVAAWMMARRGCEIVGVHFMAPPYTGQPALYKVERLTGVVARWAGNTPLLEVPFTDCQLLIRDRGPQELFTVLMRRSMMRIAEKAAAFEACGALVTGESLGQVASQTLAAIQCTDRAPSLPVLRPLIGMDKSEIMARAKALGTFDISIEPYEDCCTIFTPKHPKTQPSLAEIEAAEARLEGLAELEQKAFEGRIVRMRHFYGEEDE